MDREEEAKSSSPQLSLYSFLTSSHIVASFVLTLFLGTVLRLLFLIFNGAEEILSLEILKVLLIGFIVDSTILSFLFFPACFFLLFKPSLLCNSIKRLYLFIAVGSFLLLSFIDIFFFRVYYDRFHFYAIEQILNFHAVVSTFLAIYHKFLYGLLMLPLFFLLILSLSSPHLSFKKFFGFLFGPLVKLIKKKNNYKKDEFSSAPDRGYVYNFKVFCLHILFLFVMSFYYVQPIFSVNLSGLIYSSFDNIFYQVAANNAIHNLTSYVFKSSLSKTNIDLDESAFIKNDFQDLIKSNDDEFLDTSDFSARRFKAPRKEFQTKPHIIIINIDSLSYKFLEHSEDQQRYLPYLDKMISMGISFTDFYFHWQCSINAFTSLLLGFPMIDANNLYNYSRDPVKISIMNLLKNMGYNSLLLIGTHIYNLGSRFVHYGGDRAITPDDFDVRFPGYIEIDDQQILDRTFSEIEQHHKTSPLFVKLMLNSLHFGDVINSSSHTTFHEFSFDEHCQISDRSIYHQNLQKGLCYTNWLVENFMEKLFDLVGDNLIVVLTGEHRSWNKIAYHKNSLQSMQVPLIIVDRRGLTPRGVASSKVGSHHDLPTTLLYMIGYEGHHSFLGKNLLSFDDEEGVSAFSDTHYFYYRRGQYVVEYHRQSETAQVFQVIQSNIKTRIDDSLLRLRMIREFRTYITGTKKWLTAPQYQPISGRGGPVEQQ